MEKAVRESDDASVFRYQPALKALYSQISPRHFNSANNPNASAEFNAFDGYLKQTKPCIVH